jgi:hypothetical protein
MKIACNRFYCCLVDDYNVANTIKKATSIQVIIPPGLTREQAYDYCTGRIVRELGRYAVQEALGLPPVDENTKWDDIVT